MNIFDTSCEIGRSLQNPIDDKSILVVAWRFQDIAWANIDLDGCHAIG